MQTIGERLREERERLGLSQTACGEIGGVKKLSQLGYEKGSSFPTAAYLAALANAGADVLYILTGHRGGVVVTPDESSLLDSYRRSPQPARELLRATGEQLAERAEASTPSRPTTRADASNEADRPFPCRTTESPFMNARRPLAGQVFPAPPQTIDITVVHRKKRKAELVI